MDKFNYKDTSSSSLKLAMRLQSQTVSLNLPVVLGAFGAVKSEVGGQNDNLLFLLSAHIDSLFSQHVLTVGDTGYSKSSWRLSRLRGRSVYALELHSARFSFAPLLISSQGDNFHCASSLLTAQKRKAQTHSLTAGSSNQERETFIFVLILLPGIPGKPAGLWAFHRKKPFLALPCTAQVDSWR